MSRVAIYGRVSTTDQNFDGQIDELVALCQRSDWKLVEIYREKVSGTKSADNRPELKRLLLAAKQRQFDKVICWSVDRLGRSMRHLISTLGELHDSGVEVFAFRQGIDTSTSMGRVMWQMLGIFAELETNLRGERVALGIARAQERGVRFGRPPRSPVRTRRLKKQILVLRQDRLGINKIARQLRCSTGLVIHTLLERGLPTRLS